MARPKGSKNKPTVEQVSAELARAEVQPAVPFNYEDDDAKFDSNYQQRFQDVAYAMSAPAGAFVPDLVPVNEANMFKMPLPRGNTLFLVEGEVQLSSRAPGRGAMVAKQMRLVEAPDDNVAIHKFVNYFNGLSDAQSVYTVMNAAAMETIR